MDNGVGMDTGAGGRLGGGGQKGKNRTRKTIKNTKKKPPLKMASTKH